MIARNSLVVLAMLCAAAAAWAAGRDGLLAHSAEGRLWIAQGGREGAVVTTRIWSRQAGGGGAWAQLGQTPADVIDLAHRGGELAALLDDGNWLTFWPGGSASGTALPAGLRAAALAGDGTTLWAVGVRRPIATAPATTSAAQPGCYRLTATGWRKEADLPADFGDPSLVDLAMNDRALVLAAADQQHLRAWRYADAAWSPLLNSQLAAPLRELDLIGDSPLWLWSAGERGPGSLRRLSGDGGEVTLTGLTDLSGGRALTHGAGFLRLLFERGGKLYQQRYETDGQPNGAPEAVITPAVTDPRALDMVHWAVMVALLFILLSTIRRGREMQPETAPDLPLASLGVRLIAGLIDAVPLIAGMIYVAWQGDAWDGRLAADPAAQLPLGAATFLYLGHTLLTEVLLGRTLGKMLLGLRVVTVKGERPTAGAIALRNILRLVDLMTFFLTLLMVVYSPLRQRVGDMAAGTTVVRAKKPELPAAP